MTSRSGAQRSVSRRAFLRWAGISVGGMLATAVGGRWYVLDFEPNQLDLVYVTVSVPRLPPAFAGLTIAQISDLHFGHNVRPELVRAAVQMVLSLKPDVIVVTGDHVSRLSSLEADVIVRELSPLRAPLGAFDILGNHDHWTNADTVARAVLRAGLTLLRNASVRIDRGGDFLYIAGVDDVWEKRHDLPKALSGIPNGACVVLLAHEPDFADEAAKDSRIALQLSGHSHGGQVRLPIIGTPVLPELGIRYPEGLRKVGGMMLYTNRGIGVVNPPVRFNCPPEVTLLELRQERD